jgi:hypothetical protein
MNEWNAHNPFGEQSHFRDGELRGMWSGRYSGHPERITRLRMSAADRRDEQ